MGVRVQIPATEAAFDLNEKQVRFFDSKAKFPLLCGGMGSGKTLALILKAIVHSCTPNNYGLIGRENMSDLKVSAWKDFFDICPTRFIDQVNRSEHWVRFVNGSEILFKQLKEVSEKDLRSLNLGWFAIEQAEEVSESVFRELTGRLRRKEALNRQGFMVANPALSWLHRRYKQESDPDYELIETSTFDNKDNLPADYLDLMVRGKPEWWIKQFVYGVWDTTLLSEGAVFPSDVIAKVMATVAEARMRTQKDRLTQYVDVVKGHEYAIGVDPSEGVGGDPASMTGFDMMTGEQAFDWSGMLPPDSLATAIKEIAPLWNNALIIPEINGAGFATTSMLKYAPEIRIWRRKEYDRIQNTMTEKLGWRTTAATKPLLIARFSELILKDKIKIRSERLLSQMKTFVYTDEAKRHSMGAASGFHDDDVISAALAANAIAENFGWGDVLNPTPISSVIDTVPTITRGKDGLFPRPQPVFEQETNWLTG